MFDNFKKHILAKRIKKATMPAANITGSEIIIYERVLHNLLVVSSDIIRQAAPIIENNADRIAQAVLILEPVFKELADIKAIKTLKDANSLEEHLEDEEVKQAVENIEGYVEEFKEAVKAV